MKEKDIKASPEEKAVAVEAAGNGERNFADFNSADFELSMPQMLKNGLHFGHKKSRLHPRMQQFVFTTRNGINIVDLQKSVVMLEEAIAFLKKVRSEGKEILFIGTKKQAHDLIVALAGKLGMPFVIERWLGGTFTNFGAIKKRTAYLIKSEEMLSRGEYQKYTKFEQQKKKEEIEQLERRMGGIKNMKDLPGAIVITGVKEDNLAIKEAKRMGVPIVGIVDTNCDPSDIDFPIPANDDAISSLRYILGCVGKALVDVKPAAPVGEEKKVK